MVSTALTDTQTIIVDLILNPTAFLALVTLYDFVSSQRTTAVSPEQKDGEQSKERWVGKLLFFTDSLHHRIVLVAITMSTDAFRELSLIYHCKITMVHGNLPSGHPFLGAIVTRAKVVSLSK